MQGLVAIQEALAHLVAHCHGDHRPECPIIEVFSGDDEQAGGLQKSRSARRAFP